MSTIFGNGTDAKNLVDPIYTDNLELPLMQPDEVADYMGKWNETMNKLDMDIQDLKNAVDGISDLSLKVDQIDNKVNTNSTDIEELEELVESAEQEITSIKTQIAQDKTKLNEVLDAMQTTVATHWAGTESYDNILSNIELTNTLNGVIDNLADLADTVAKHWTDAGSWDTPTPTNKSNMALTAKIYSMLNTISDIQSAIADLQNSDLNSLATRVSTIEAWREWWKQNTTRTKISVDTSTDSPVSSYILAGNMITPNGKNPDFIELDIIIEKPDFDNPIFTKSMIIPWGKQNVYRLTAVKDDGERVTIGNIAVATQNIQVNVYNTSHVSTTVTVFWKPIYKNGALAYTAEMYSETVN